MIVTSDFLAGLLTNFRAIFQTEMADLDKTLAEYKLLATIFPSTTDKESYGWMGATPAMSEWRAQRILSGLNSYDYTLTNKNYEATIEVDRNTIEDDKYGMITPRIRGLAMRVLRYFNERVFSQLDDGATLLAYDGIAMFTDSRTIGDSANIDNLLTGAYSGSADEIRNAVAAAISLMRNYQDDKGVKMNLVPDLIVCSPAMEIPIKSALLPAVAGVDRPESVYFPPSRVISTPWVDLDADNWYMLCTQAEVKPVILQVRKEPDIVSLDDPKGQWAFMNRTFLYGVDCRFQTGYGDPRCAIKVVDQ